MWKWHSRKSREGSKGEEWRGEGKGKMKDQMQRQKAWRRGTEEVHRGVSFN